MPAPIDVYPLATQDGQQIHMEAMRPIHLTILPFSATPFAVVDTTLKLDKMYELYSKVDCILCFDATPIQTVQGGNCLALRGGMPIVFTPSPLLKGLSVISTVAGELYIQEMVSWAGLNNPSATLRG